MRRKKFRPLRMHPKYWGVILFALALLFASGYRSQQRHLDEMAVTIDELTAEQELLVDDILRLQRKIDFSKTDEFIEREARSKLSLIKEGEILFKSAD